MGNHHLHLQHPWVICLGNPDYSLRECRYLSDYRSTDTLSPVHALIPNPRLSRGLLAAYFMISHRVVTEFLAANPRVLGLGAWKS